MAVTFAGTTAMAGADVAASAGAVGVGADCLKDGPWNCGILNPPSTGDVPTAGVGAVGASVETAAALRASARGGGALANMMAGSDIMF